MPRRQLPEILCIDEVHVNISKYCKYALVLQDFITGEPIDLVVSRREEYTLPYFAKIPRRERSRVKYLISDMYRPYLAYVDKYFPNAVSVIDAFHVIQLINRYFLQYIRNVQRKLDARDRLRHEDGPIEALNRIPKDMKRIGRGYRNFSYLRNRFLFSQRKNAAILAVPKTLDEVLLKSIRPLK